MKKTVPVLLLLLLLAVAGRSQPPGSPSTPTFPPGTAIHRDLAYVEGGHALQKLDLYLPGGTGPWPLVVYVHGGAFRAGDKSRFPTEPLELGYALASVNYRLSGDAPAPAQIVDCKTAVRWLRANAARYRLDPDRFAALGESAGGNLVALLGTTGGVAELEAGAHRDVSSRVKAVVDLFGPTDFLQMDAHRLPDGMVHDAADSPESVLVRGPIQERKAEVARVNPVTYVSGDDAPFLIVHGDRDPLVPHHQSELLAAALEKAGVPVTFHTVKGGGHGGFADPRVPELTRAFLGEHLGPPRR
jgi:acetyl esterase/lipase